MSVGSILDAFAQPLGQDSTATDSAKIRRSIRRLRRRPSCAAGTQQPARIPTHKPRMSGRVKWQSQHSPSRHVPASGRSSLAVVWPNAVLWTFISSARGSTWHYMGNKKRMSMANALPPMEVRDFKFRPTSLSFKFETLPVFHVCCLLF
jgi:hypothetical protein